MIEQLSRISYWLEMIERAYARARRPALKSDFYQTREKLGLARADLEEALHIKEIA